MQELSVIAPRYLSKFKPPPPSQRLGTVTVRTILEAGGFSEKVIVQRILEIAHAIIPGDEEKMCRDVFTALNFSFVPVKSSLKEDIQSAKQSLADAMQLIEKSIQSCSMLERCVKRAKDYEDELAKRSKLNVSLKGKIDHAKSLTQEYEELHHRALSDRYFAHQEACLV